jgi:hypothetical protein
VYSCAITEQRFKVALGSSLIVRIGTRVRVDLRGSAIPRSGALIKESARRSHLGVRFCA